MIKNTVVFDFSKIFLNTLILKDSMTFFLLYEKKASRNRFIITVQKCL